MAKKSLINRENRRRNTVSKFAAKRGELITILKSSSASEEEKVVAREKLQKLPRNASPVRLRNRCSVTGRPRAFLRKYGVSRITFRELASQGKVPGVTKSSW